MNKKIYRAYTQEEKGLIIEGYQCLIDGSMATLKTTREAKFARANEIKAKLGFKKYRQVISIEGKLLV